MKHSNREMRPGDLLVTTSGEMYIYIGYYKGIPKTFYRTTEKGYLYIFIQSRVYADIPSESRVIQMLILRLAGEFYNNARYTKQPKQFSEYIKHYDLGIIQDKINNAYGLTRLGDRK